MPSLDFIILSFAIAIMAGYLNYLTVELRRLKKNTGAIAGTLSGLIDLLVTRTEAIKKPKSYKKTSAYDASRRP